MSESEQPKSEPVAQTAPKNSLGTPAAIIVAGIIVAAAIIFSGGEGGTSASAPTPTPTGGNEKEQLALAAMQPDDHVRGNRDADVYILEFSDTECPFCKRFHETMIQVMNEYGDRVAWVYRHFPLASLHPTAARESEALECANELGGPDIFWAYADTVYERTPQGAALTDEDLFSFAVELGLDRTEFVTCLNSGKYSAEVQKDLDNAIALGGRGTPHSFIVTKDKMTQIRGAQPFSVVKASLDAILAEQ
jgi:protein-disulfide isomerase